MEYNKMINEHIYDSSDERLVDLRTKCHDLCLEYNTLKDNDNRRNEVIATLLGNKSNVYLQGPIYFDYGINTTFGNNCYVNFNFTCLDCAKVKVGDNVFIGPNVSILTPVHPLLNEERKMFVNERGILATKEYAKGVTISSGVWIGGNVTILPGVTIGENSVIGAGSVVSKDIPSNVVAFGNPCKVHKKLTKEDSIYNKDLL